MNTQILLYEKIVACKPCKYSRCLGYGYEARFGYWLRLREKNEETINVAFY